MAASPPPAPPVASLSPLDDALRPDDVSPPAVDQPRWMRWVRKSPSWLTSLILHLSLLLVLAAWILPNKPRQEIGLLSSMASRDEPADELVELHIDAPPLEVQTPLEAPQASPAEAAQLDLPPTLEPQASERPAEEFAAAVDFGEATAPKAGLLQAAGGAGGGLSSRGAAERGRLVTERGGSSESEAAVAMALAWLAAHQNADGSWDLDHRHGACQGRCPDGGMLDSSHGATALALLPFLGAGQTQKEGQYQRTVEDGLQYLVQELRHSRRGKGGLDDGGTFYAQGISAIALCEAYAMTRDARLRQPAQATLDYIVQSQDPRGGGWRYMPRQPGDTSVFGWQLLALKSGRLAYLEVPGATLNKASHYLDSVQVDYGAAYGYVTPMATPANSAVGLLCRMHLGWRHDHPPLKAGVHDLARIGPSDQDIYYNYYATQTLFQYTSAEGPLWRQWNQRMREQLLASQARSGHMAGSWFFPGDHSSAAGGRLYCTALATLILEVYYRHLPVFREAAVREAFPE